jgi:hypothetical protein
MLFYGDAFVRHTLTVTNWEREMQQFVYLLTFVSVIHAIKLLKNKYASYYFVFRTVLTKKAGNVQLRQAIVYFS